MQDKYHLYFLFDMMAGGDLMDVLMAEAQVVKMRVPRGALRRGCLAPQVRVLRGMGEGLARFYVASIVLALEYLHDNNIGARCACFVVCGGGDGGGGGGGGGVRGLRVGCCVGAGCSGGCVGWA